MFIEDRDMVITGGSFGTTYEGRFFWAEQKDERDDPFKVSHKLKDLQSNPCIQLKRDFYTNDVGVFAFVHKERPDTYCIHNNTSGYTKDSTTFILPFKPSHIITIPQQEAKNNISVEALAFSNELNLMVVKANAKYENHKDRDGVEWERGNCWVLLQTGGIQIIDDNQNIQLTGFDNKTTTISIDDFVKEFEAKINQYHEEHGVRFKTIEIADTTIEVFRPMRNYAGKLENYETYIDERFYSMRRKGIKL